MYNRYMPHDEGSYHYIPAESFSWADEPAGRPDKEEKGIRSFLRNILEKLRLDRFDRGDLLLLLILLLLYY